MCRPGASLVVDIGPDGRDLCVVGGDRKTHSPRCAARSARRYLQRLVYRAFLPVEGPDGVVTRRWMDVRKTEIGRVESLLRHRPIIQGGPAGCCYARVERRVHQRRVPPNIDAPPIQKTPAAVPSPD